MQPINEYHLEHAEVRVEPHLVYVHVLGSLGQEQVPQMIVLMKQIMEQQGRLFLLIDLREGGGMSSAMRRMLSQAMVDFSPAAMGIYGANLEQRAMHALLMGAVTGASGRRPNAAYFQTEAEAREWLAAERQRLIGKPP